MKFVYRNTCSRDFLQTLPFIFLLLLQMYILCTSFTMWLVIVYPILLSFVCLASHGSQETIVHVWRPAWPVPPQTTLISTRKRTRSVCLQVQTPAWLVHQNILIHFRQASCQTTQTLSMLSARTSCIPLHKNRLWIAWINLSSHFYFWNFIFVFSY